MTLLQKEAAPIAESPRDEHTATLAFVDHFSKALEGLERPWPIQTGECLTVIEQCGGVSASQLAGYYRGFLDKGYIRLQPREKRKPIMLTKEQVTAMALLGREVVEHSERYFSSTVKVPASVSRQLGEKHPLSEFITIQEVKKIGRPSLRP